MKKPYQRTLWFRRLLWWWSENIRAGLIHRDVSELEIIPWWMGIAYRRWECLQTVCYVVPLNWVVYLLREVWWRLKRPGGEHLQDLAAYKAGYEKGFQTGLRRQVIEEFEERGREYLRGKSGAEEAGPGLTATGVESPQGGVRF